jgi:hypothetical protein
MFDFDNNAMQLRRGFSDDLMISQTETNNIDTALACRYERRI